MDGTAQTIDMTLGTLLIVDDETDIAEEMCEFLSDEGYRTILAGSLKEAHDKINEVIVRGGRIDLVVSDLRMPGGSGTDLIAQVREANMLAPFILVTGHGEIVDDASTVSGLANSGAALVMKKPVEIDVLLEQIEALIGVSEPKAP